jgi:hypothetical protein
VHAARARTIATENRPWFVNQSVTMAFTSFSVDGSFFGRVLFMRGHLLGAAGGIRVRAPALPLHAFCVFGRAVDTEMLE